MSTLMFVPEKAVRACQIGTQDHQLKTSGQCEPPCSGITPECSSIPPCSKRLAKTACKQLSEGREKSLRCTSDVHVEVPSEKGAA